MRITGRLGGGFTPFGDADGLYLPSRYSFEVDDTPAGVLVVDVVVEDGRPVAESVAVRRHPGGPSVTAESLRRIALGRYLRASAAVAAMSGSQNADGSITLEPVDASVDADALVDADRRAAGRGRRREITAAHLIEVARVYQAGQPRPTTAVAEAWNVSVPTASRWVREARRRGHLPPYRRGEQ